MTTFRVVVDRSLQERLSVAAEPNDVVSPEATHHFEDGGSSTTDGGDDDPMTAPPPPPSCSGHRLGSGNSSPPPTDPRVDRVFDSVLAVSAASQHNSASTSSRGEPDEGVVASHAPVDGNEPTEPDYSENVAVDFLHLCDRLSLETVDESLLRNSAPGSSSLLLHHDGGGRRRRHQPHSALSLPTLAGSCLACGTLIATYTEGLFCANALASRGDGMYPPCGGVWCGPCYKAGDDDDTAGAARPGEHLLTPFQCETCHFVNLQQRLPSPDTAIKDQTLLAAIRRANLDAFAARSDDAVQEQALEIQEALNAASEWGLPWPVPPPFPVADTFGMMTAAMCVANADGGEITEDDDASNTGLSRYHGACRTRDAMMNYHGTTVAGVLDRRSAPESGRWFGLFMEGLHFRLVGQRP